jgi:hypothetical protein
MKISFALLFTALSLTAAPSPVFFPALHHVETSSRYGAIWGDNHKALGPLQIHKAYFQCSGVTGRWEQCSDYAFSVRVVTAYLKKHAPVAFARGDDVSLARVHNGGPRGASSPATLRYAAKFRSALNDVSKR